MIDLFIFTVTFCNTLLLFRNAFQEQVTDKEIENIKFHLMVLHKNHPIVGQMDNN